MTDPIILGRKVAVNAQVVLVLQDLIQQAQHGNITSISCVCVGPNGSVQIPGAGSQISEMNLGADLLKSSLMAAVTGDRSKIVKPA